MMRPMLGVSVLAVCAFAGGRLAASGDSPVTAVNGAAAPKVVAPPTRLLTHAVGEGPSQGLRIELTPGKLDSKADGEELTVELRVVNDEDSAKVFAYSTALFDDSGAAFVPHTESKTFRVSPKKSAAAPSVTLPAGLPDGYYYLVAEVVFRDAEGNRAGGSDDQLYLRVVGGKVELMNAEDWIHESDVMTPQPL